LEKENLGIAVGVLERARCARVSFGEIATERSSDLTFASAQEHLSARRRFPLVGRPQGKIIMRLATIGLATALALTSTFALAQGGAGGSAGGGSTAGGSTATGGATGSAAGTTGLGTTSPSTGTTTGSAPNSLGNNAGSAAAGANSTLNPSGNSYINTSPSGSTLGPNGPSSGVGR
jgi:hypothetical protein